MGSDGEKIVVLKTQLFAGTKVEDFRLARLKESKIYILVRKLEHNLVGHFILMCINKMTISR